MVRPYQNKSTDKKTQIEEMFDNISPEYDRLNHILSMNIDKLWRRRAIKILKQDQPKLILDVATGTADFAIESLKVNPVKVTGVDLSEGMLELGRKKIKERNLTAKIELIKGDSENLPFSDNSYDAATVAFGVRNFENLEKGLSEMLRVLKPNGKLIVLEFSKPRSFPFKQLYSFYSTYILPTVGAVISKDKKAYEYLPESVKEFPDGRDFTNILEKVGFTNTEYKIQTFGVATIYIAQKPK